MSIRDKTVPVAAYIPIPSSATPIPRPTAESNSYNRSSTTNGSAPAPPPSTQPFASTPSFPPSASTHPPTGTRKTTTSSGISGISTNVSDLLLSSLLPPGLPKLPSSTTASSGPGVSNHGAGARDGRGHAKPRELSTVREGLRLDVMSNNFRRFVTKVGPVFWMQDRVEEVLFWRKPVWTWAWILAWGCISFQPRLLLLAPFLILLVILLHTQERLHPVKTLLGVGSAPSAVTARLPAHKVFRDSPATANVAGGNGATTTGRPGTGDHAGAGGGKSQGQDVTTTTGPDGELLPAVPFKEAESGVDYFMNLQAIQNTMGWVSDAYDDIAPILSSLSQPSSTSPTSLPISGTSLIILLLPPTALLPLTPPWLMPYLLLFIGWGPTLYYHPHLAPLIRSVPQSALARRLRAMIIDLLLTDALPDDIGRCTIDRVEVWENERLDPAIMAKPASATLANAGGSGGGVPPGSWSYRHLRAGERLPWVKVVPRDDLAAVGSGSGRSRRLSKLSNASASIRDDVHLSETNSSVIGTASSSPSAAFPGSRSKSPWYDPHDSLPRPTTSNNTGASHEDESTSAALRLQDGWKWVPGEEWMIDTSAEWCEAGTDSEGWVYSDDSWQSMAPRPVIDADTAGPMPALRRPTRRRRWWRRVYLAPQEELGGAI